MKLPKVIVGIDPGTTAAVAVINLKGKLLALESRRNFGKNNMIKYISSIGSPTIIATDKALPPSMVMKVSSNFNSFVFYPEEDLKHREKIDIVRNFKAKDSHQKDALAAALFAYSKNEDMLKRVEKTVEGLGLWTHVDEVKDIILRGRCSNTAEAIELVLSMERGPEKKIIKRKGKVTKGDVENILGKLRGNLKEKEKSIAILERYAGKLEGRVKFLEDENNKLKKVRSKKRTKKQPEKKDYKVKNLESELKKKNEKLIEMNKRVNTLKELEMTRKKGLVPVKVVKDSSYEELVKIEKELGLYRDLLYFREYSRIDKKLITKLKEREIEIIVGNFPENVKEKIEKEGIIVLGKKEIEIRIIGGCGMISKENAKKVRKKGFIGWLKEYRKRSND